MAVIITTVTITPTQSRMCPAADGCATMEEGLNVSVLNLVSSNGKGLD